jgi:hypothetical protein
LEEKPVYRLKLFQGYQMTLNPEGVYTLEGGTIKGNNGIYENERGRCAM